MIRQLKILFRLLPLSHRFKISIIAMPFMNILGIAMTLIYPGAGIGILFLMMGQLITSLTVSDMVQASPLKKALQTRLVAAATFLSLVVSYLLVIVLDGINRYLYPAYTDTESIYERLECCIIIFLFVLYISFCYKYFVLSSIVFFIGIETITMLSSFERFNPVHHGIAMNVPLPLMTLIGFVVICLSSLMQYGITCLLYRKPLSKAAQCSDLRKQM